MVLIEGIGDEVTAVMAGLLIILLLVIAWCSTTVTEQPLFRTAVLVITRCHHRSSSSRSNTADETAPSTSTATTENSSLLNNPSPETGECSQTNVEECSAKANVEENSETVKVEENSTHISEEENKSSTEPPEEPTKSEESDQASFVRNRRLQNLVSERSAGGADSGYREPPPPSQSEEDPPRTEEATTDDVTVEDSTDIGNGMRVKIKFLNDTQKLVEARPNDLLGDFRRRHFADELASNKIVRLIFNGQLLVRDNDTLQHVGLFDNCTIHCQIAQGRNATAPAPGNVGADVPPLDLAHLMMPIFGGILALVWYARIYYRQLFNATSTFALFAISGFYLLSLLSVLVNRHHHNNNNNNVRRNR